MTTRSRAEQSVEAGWVRACSLSELPDGGVIRVELGPRCPLAIVRTEGAVYAIRDVCSHADVPLSEGEVDGTTLECWLHGSRFDLRTGRPTGLPATKPVPVHQTMIDGDDVFVRMEEK
jgi:3-phenylpropionate/trans-cinnamate dioxygenase ferredoxin subunit